jgi:hypothetical protein
MIPNKKYKFLMLMRIGSGAADSRLAEPVPVGVIFTDTAGLTEACMG